MDQGITFAINNASDLTAMPSVSVIIPTYNRAQLITASIDSVLGQTIWPNEIIVVDDESTDETEAVIRSMKSQIPIIYHRQQNQGPAKASNAGVAMAHGEWIAFLDSDDEWLPAKIEVQLQVACGRSNVPFIYSKMMQIGRTGEPLHTRKPIGLLELLYFECTPCPSTVLLRKQVFNEMKGLKPDLRYAEEMELF